MSDDFAELDRLLHEATFFPGLNARLASIPPLMNIVEQQFESGRTKEISRLLKEHKMLGKDLHPDDKQFDLEVLESQVIHFLPKMFRGGYVLTLYSVLERSLMDIVQRSALHTGVSLPEDYFRNGSFFPTMRNAIRLSSGVVDAFSNRDEYKKLRQLKSVRHTLIHHDGRLQEAPADLKNLPYTEFEKIGLILEKDYNFTFIVPNKHFLADNTELVINCIRRIASQVYETLNPEIEIT